MATRAALTGVVASDAKKRGQMKGWLVFAWVAAVALVVPVAGGTQSLAATGQAGSAVAAVPVQATNMEWVTGLPQAVGSDIEFLERRNDDGSLSRYAIVGNIGGGFQIIDITDPVNPLPVSFYASPHGYQGDIQVNPRRNIVVFATDLDGSVAHSGDSGIELVDITDLSNPQRLSVVSGIGGAHNSTIVDDNYIYTSSPSHIIDYSDASNPVSLGRHDAFCSTHDITLNPNRPDRVYLACPSSEWRILDVTEPANPQVVASVRDLDIVIAHQIDPSPDSSLVVVSDERGGGVSHHRCPGGGAHVYDISGKHTDGEASETNPVKIGTWFPPFTGLGSDGNAGRWGNCTMHNFTFQAERWLLSVGWYSAGAWVADFQNATVYDGDPYQEYQGTDPQVPNNTTWGNTMGNALLAGDEVWSTKWTRFDDPAFDRYAFNSGMTRGFDVLEYTGPMPEKVARLAAEASAAGDTVSGTLDRYAVWTYEGWVNKPLADKTVTVTVDGTDAGTAATADDGTFSLPVDLAPGQHTVEVTWPGDDAYQPVTVTTTVTVTE